MTDMKDFRVKKVAVVSHNYNLLNRYGHYDFAEHFSRINQVCDSNGCDTILYSLFTWNEKSPVSRNHKNIFNGLKNVKYVILEVGNKKSTRKLMEIWLKDNEKPRLLEQHFAKSSEPYYLKKEFISDIKSRIIGNSLIVICGESNIVNYQPQDGNFRDQFGFNRILKSSDVRVVFNPLHDYMTRYEMKRKRAYYSMDGRTVITVWNQGKRKGESHIPWTVFHDGQDVTGKVQEVSPHISDRSDIRIGIVPEIIQE